MLIFGMYLITLIKLTVWLEWWYIYICIYNLLWPNIDEGYELEGIVIEEWQLLCDID